MKVINAVSLGIGGLLAVGLVIGQITAQTPAFAAQGKAIADFTGTVGGTWTLKQRLNPDGTPYKTVQGITYISVSTRNGQLLGPHSVATVYAKESGVVDGHFFKYAADVVGKPFQMESTGTWLIQNTKNTDSGSQVSARIYSMAKGNLEPYPNGLVMSADIIYNLSRQAPRAGAAVAPKLEFASLKAGELMDLVGNRVDPSSMVAACCGMSSLVVFQDTMEINWSNKGKDIWVKSAKTVPAAYR